MVAFRFRKLFILARHLNAPQSPPAAGAGTLQAITMTPKSAIFFLFLFSLLTSCFRDCYSGVSWTNSKNGDKLYDALMAGNTSQTENLLRKKINPNVTTLTGEALISAATGKPEILKLYIKYGADIENEGTCGRTPLEYALLYCHFESARLLISSGAKVDSLNAGNYPILFQIIARTTYPNTCPPSTCIDSLVVFGVNLNYQDNEGDTPLTMSAYNENVEAANILIKRGAIKTIKNNKGLTALDIAIKKNNQALISLLTQ